LHKYDKNLRKGPATAQYKRLTDALSSWEADLKHCLRLRTTPDVVGLLAAAARKHPERKSSAAMGPSFTSGFPLVSAVSLLIKASCFHRTQPHLPTLWTSLLQQKGCIHSLEAELAFVRSGDFKKPQPHADSTTPARVTFGDPIALYRDKDRDLLVSFAVSPVPCLVPCLCCIPFDRHVTVLACSLTDGFSWLSAQFRTGKT
jgi:hypothetical protein